jgi:Putative beta-barrel porin-2, OmpL-like. bbp2
MNSVKKLRVLFTLTILGISSFAFAQEAATEEEEKTFTLSGSIDVYAHTGFGSENVWGFQAPTTSFGNLKGFALGMANLIASYQGEKSGFVADLVFGPRGTDASFNSGRYTNLAGSSSAQIINQLYAYYKFSDAFTLNMGQFNTFVGYEVISPTLNVNYSTSYLFSNGPFNHTGLRGDLSFGEGMVAKIAVMNPTDILEFNPVNTFTYGAQIGKTGDFGGVWLNFIYGDQDGTLDEDDDYQDENGDPVSSFGSLFQADITASFNISETFAIGVNASYQTIGAGEMFVAPGEIEDIDADASSFLGFAVYPKFTLSESFALGLRAEYFSTDNYHPLASPIAFDDEGAGNIIALTLSGNYKVGGLMIIPEVRFDKGSEDNFLDGDSELTDSMLSATLAAVYKF